VRRKGKYMDERRVGRYEKVKVEKDDAQERSIWRAGAMRNRPTRATDDDG